MGRHVRSRRKPTLGGDGNHWPVNFGRHLLEWLVKDDGNLQSEAKHELFGFIIWISSHSVFPRDQAASRSSNRMRLVDGGGVANSINSLKASAIAASCMSRISSMHSRDTWCFFAMAVGPRSPVALASASSRKTRCCGGDWIAGARLQTLRKVHVNIPIVYQFSRYIVYRRFTVPVRVGGID